MKNGYLGIIQITRFIILAAFTAGFFFVACSGGDVCNDEVRSQVNLGFYTMSSGTPKDTTPRFLAMGIIEGDSVLIKTTNKLQKFSLPLSPNDEQLSYILIFSTPQTRYENDTIQVIDNIDFIPDTSWLNETTIDTIVFIPDTTWTDSAFVATINYYTYVKDTLSFNYETKLKLVSPECGFTANYLIHSVSTTNNRIAADSILNPEITTDETENVKIYF